MSPGLPSAWPFTLVALHFLFQEVKLSSPDYKDVNKDEAVTDFLSRIEHYKRAYNGLDETDEKHLSFIVVYNQGQRFLVNKVDGK